MSSSTCSKTLTKVSIPYFNLSFVDRKLQLSTMNGNFWQSFRGNNEDFLSTFDLFWQFALFGNYRGGAIIQTPYFDIVRKLLSDRARGLKFLGFVPLC